MIYFQQYFEKKVTSLLNESNEQTFFIFRGFGLKQIKYLIQHPNSILSDSSLLKNNTLNLSALEKNKKQLNKTIFLSEKNIIGFYEELITILSVIKDPFSCFSGKIIIINNNLFTNAVPNCLTQQQAVDLFDYMQSDETVPSTEVKLITNYYSNAKILDSNHALLYPINVYKDLKIPVIDFFQDISLHSNTTESERSILLGSEEDYLYRLSIIDNNIQSINIKKDISCEEQYALSLQKTLEHLRIPYSIEEINLKLPDIEYNDTQFLPYLKKYWGPTATFRKLEFYKDPNTSKALQTISQGSLISEIIDQCELAQDDDEYRDIFITAPTGAGKSLLFQLPAIYISDKYNLVTIVISPLIALMNDQVAQLRKKHNITSVACINSSISFEERQKIINEIHSGEKSIIYLAPELLLSTGLKTLLGERKLGLLVIDEAHTVTSWGRDFRADYWFLGDFFRSVKKNKKSFPILCLTATAVYTGVDDVVNDTISELDLNNPILHLGNVKRNNIIFDINYINKNIYEIPLETKKKELLLDRLRKYIKKNEKVLAYCPYVKHVNCIYNELSVEERKIIKRYHGQLEKQEKNLTEKEYRQGKVLALICTKAFGMGIDRADIKHVIHFAPTGNLADYVQEIGRAARNIDITGIAHIDFFLGDMRYVKTLHGLSEMKQFQLKAMLKKISDIYKSKQERNLLIAPDSFSHLFQEKELVSKVKNGLLMLSKDLKNKYGFPVLIVRPKVMLTQIFVGVPDSLRKDFLDKFGGYCRKLGKISDKIIPGAYGNDICIKYPGTVFSLKIGEVWEKRYSNLTFSAFKQQIFTPDFIQDNEGRHLTPRMQVNITYYKNFDDIKLFITNLLDSIITVFAIHEKADKKTFEEKDFYSELNNVLKEPFLDKNQVSMLLNMLTVEISDNIKSPPNNPLYKILQKRKSKKNNVSEYLIINNYSRIKGLILRLLSDCYPNNDMEYHSYVPYTTDRSISIMPLLKLMEILNLASYDLKGGEKTEIFIRINDPEKIKRLAYSRYKNEVLNEIKRKHQYSQEILRIFFTNDMNNSDRWNFIEDYFLGRKEEIDVY